MKEMTTNNTKGKRLAGAVLFQGSLLTQYLCRSSGQFFRYGLLVFPLVDLLEHVSGESGRHGVVRGGE